MKKSFLTVVLSLALLLMSAPSFAKSDHPFELNEATVEDLTGRCFFSEDDAYKILDLRDKLGGFQTWDDIKELKLTEAQESVLKGESTISGIQVDCGC